MNEQPAPSAGARSPIEALIWLLSALLVAAVVALTYWLLQTERQEALDRADALVRQAMAGAEADLNRTLAGVDVVLAALPGVVRPALRPTGGLDAAKASQLLMGLTVLALQLHLI